MFTARTTQSVLTHLDSSTFARPLWAKNIKISFIAASLCVSLRPGPPVTPRRHPTADRYVTFLFYSLFRGFSEIRASDVIICQSTPLLLIYYLKARRINSTPPYRCRAASLRIAVIYMCIALAADSPALSNNVTVKRWIALNRSCVICRSGT